MLARNVRKAARSALWLPVPDGFWDANTKAVPSWMVTASSTRKPLPGGHWKPTDADSTFKGLSPVTERDPIPGLTCDLIAESAKAHRTP